MGNTRTSFMTWREHRLAYAGRLSGYSVVQDEKYPTMWRVRSPDGALSDMVNRARAKDAAMAMLARDLRARPEAAGTSPTA